MNKWINTYRAADQHNVSASSRDGRLRYYLADGATKSESLTSPADINGATVTWNIDYENGVAAPQQHDDVIYNIGKRSAHCDGMGTTANHGKPGQNHTPMTTTGHVNKWADGILYTNPLGSGNQTYSGYDNNSPYLTAINNFAEGKNNDTKAIGTSYYRERYDQHDSANAKGVTDKTMYSNQSDSKDRATTEWQVFNKCRRTKIVVDVISDFLILQTSGGDQVLYYYEKESKPTEAQRHFQK